MGRDATGTETISARRVTFRSGCGINERHVETGEVTWAFPSEILAQDGE